MKRLLSIAAVLLTVAACADATGVPDGQVGIAPVEQGLEITNSSSVDLFYEAIDVDVLALWAGPTDITMCSDPDCPHVAPGQTVVVPWDQVLGWRDDTTKIAVYWWRVVPDGEGGWRVASDDVHSREIDVS